MAIAPDSILGEAISAVNSQMTKLDNMADRYNRELSGALAKISEIKPDNIDAPQSLPVPELPSSSVKIGEIPTINIPALALPRAPNEVDISSLLGAIDIDLGAIPDAPIMPTISIPAAPAINQIAAPSRPNVDTNIPMPDAPIIVIPEMEALNQINLPEFVFPTLPDFNGNPPSADDITVPSVFINWTEPEYRSENLDELKAKLSAMMTSGTGIPKAVEDALFSRVKDRQQGEIVGASSEVITAWASRGFSMPQGAMEKQLRKIKESGMAKMADTNREIFIQAAQWEIDGMRFAVQQGMALEQLTQNLFSNTVNRLFEAAKFQAEAQINVFNAQIGLFNAKSAGYNAIIETFKIKLEAALSKITAYKAAIDGQAAIGQINSQKVEVFKAKLGAVQSKIEVFKSEMQGAQVRAEAVKNLFDAYRADIQAYGEQLGAEKSKLDAYESYIKGEQAKAGMFDSQARAYASTIQALSSKADVKIRESQLKMEAAKVRITEFASNVDLHKAKLQAQVSQSEAAIRAFQTQIEAWKAKVSTEISVNDAAGRFAEAQARTSMAYSQMKMSEYTAKVQASTTKTNIALEGAKAVGQFTAQLAAGAMSAAHVSASIGGSGSASSTESISNSTSTTYSYGDR